MLHKRSIREKLLKGGAWAFSGKIITALTGLGANALLARLLPPEELGAYFLTVSLVTIAAIAAQLGLSQTIVRLVAESMGTDRPGRARLAVRWAVRLVGLGAILMASILAFGGGSWVANIFFHSKMMSEVMGMAAVWVVFLTFQRLIAEIFRGFHDILLATIFGGLVTGLLALLMFFGLWLSQGGGSLQQIMLLTLVAAFSSVVLSSWLLRKKLSMLPLTLVDEISVLEVLSISWPLWVSQLMVFIILQADLWVVGFFLEKEDVAIYGAAFRIVALLTIVSTVFSAFLIPIVAEMKANDDLERLQSILTSSAFANTVIVFPVFICLVFFSASVLELVYGEYYLRGKWVLIALSIGFFFNVLTGMRGQVLIVTGHEKIQMFISLFGGMMSVLFCIIGALTKGLDGVAIGAMSGVIFQSIMELTVVKLKLGIWTHATPMNIKNLLLICSK